MRREHTSRRSWKSQEQKALVIGELIEKSTEFQQKIQQIKDEANGARSEAAKEQHEVSKPWAGEEKMVAPQVEAAPSSDKRGKVAKEKADLLEVSRPAVERAETIKRKSPELAEKVASGELSATAALKEIRRAEQVAAMPDYDAFVSSFASGV